MGRASLGVWGSEGSAVPRFPVSPTTTRAGMRGASLRAAPAKDGVGLRKPKGYLGVLGAELSPAVPVSCVSPGC